MFRYALGFYLGMGVVVSFPLDAWCVENNSAAEVTRENGVKIIREKSSTQPAPRSDRRAMEQGEMRSDRTLDTPGPKQPSPLIVHPNAGVATTQAALPEPLAEKNAHEEIAPESDAITGLHETNDPVLALFDGGSGELLSFAEAMQGGRAKHLWLWPIPANAKQTFSSGYGPRKDPFHGHMAFHGGIDIAAPVGTPVMAVADGEVAEVKTDAGFGKYIGIKHKDGSIARYGHLSEQNVREGQYVRAGQTIGAVGQTGRATGAHLDFRISRNDVRFDPLSVLSVPSTVALNGVSVPPVAQQPAFARPKIASNALPRAPMVIKVTD